MVNPARDILTGLVVGLVAAGAWNAYKKEELRKTDAYYKQYDQDQAKIVIRTARKKNKHATSDEMGRQAGAARQPKARLKEKAPAQDLFICRVRTDISYRQRPTPTMASLELDLDEKIFDHDDERQKLHEQMAQLSPRREANDGKFEVMTLPFYDEISPSTALEKLFNWFHAPIVDAPTYAAVADASAENDEEEKGVDEGADQLPPSEPAEKEKHQAMTLVEFNDLRRCLGKDEVSQREWDRALEELGMPPDKKHVRKADFKALFGPPPFFGSDDVHGIVKYVMSAEERVHFAQILLDRFGVAESGGDGSVLSKSIGFEALKNIQVACYVDPVFGDAEWNELKRKMSIPEDQHHLDWKKFTESFAVSIKNKKVFGSHSDPASVVYAVLANDKLQSTLRESTDGIVSRTTITNLLKLKQSNVSDDKWMQLLEEMKTSYHYQKELHSQESENTGISDVPLVVVRNTRNQVLSYEITFDEHDEIGLELQSDFYGHCLTVASIRGQAAKHPIIQQHDIVAMIDTTRLTYEDPAADKAEEQKRIDRGIHLLEGRRSRKITFQRQESYFQYDPAQKCIRLFVKTLENIPGRGKFHIQLPTESSWSPTTYSTGNEAECLTVTFDEPSHEDLDFATVMWIPDTKTIEVTLDGQFTIAANTSVVLEIGEIMGGEAKMVGPCEFGDNAKILCVNLISGWKNREVAFHSNPVRDRVRRRSDYYDKSLEPIERNFDPGDSGIELVGDFFGQCAVVKNVKKSSQAADRRIQEFDILTSISYVGENNSLERVHCIKSLASDKESSAVHVKQTTNHLIRRHKSGGMYRLQFLRLNTHFHHDIGRTIVTLRALTTLTSGSVLVMRMPNARWHVTGQLTASVIDPVDVKIKEVFWDSSHQTLHMRLSECSIAESAPVLIEVEGLSSGDETKKLCAGPGEVTGVHVGDDVTVPEMEIQFHDNWDVVAQETYEVSKIVQTLKQFNTSPAKLWEVLEYTSLLFDIYKPSPTSDHLNLSDLNRLIGTACGDSKKMKEPDWKSLCMNLDADSFVGLTRRQFACCWYDVVGLSSHKAKDTYIRLHTAERLFRELIEIYQDDEDADQEIMSEDTINRLTRLLKFSTENKKKAIKDLKSKGLSGWDCDTFSQIVCSKHPIITIEEKDAMALWMKLYYSKKLFDAYNSKNLMRKKNMADLLAAAKIKTPKFTTELWTNICDSVGADDNSGLSLGDFLDVYAGELLGSRHAVGDWYRIETFKLLPERRAKDDTSKEAVISVAPEKVNVKDVAAKILDQTASTEEIFQDLVEKGLEFSKLEDIREQVSETFQFETELCAKRKSRATGFLQIGLKSITELADHIIQRDTSFDAKGVAEELYVMFQITTAPGLKPRLPDHKPRGRFVRTMEALFGQKDLATEYVVRDDEMWDQGRTQELMRDLKKAEKALKACKPRTPEYAEALVKLKDLENELTPPSPFQADVPEWRVFSSLILRDPSPDAIIRFPDDHFRVFVPPHKKTDQLYIVCKLFKRIGSEASSLKLRLDNANEAFNKANLAHKILMDLVQQQQDHLRHVIADRHMKDEDPAKQVRSEVWTSVAKLKQLRQDLAEFEVEVTTRETAVRELTEALKAALETQAEDDRVGVYNGDDTGPHSLNEPFPSSPGVEGTKSKRSSFRPMSVKLEVDKVKDAKPRLEAKKVKFIGQAFFDLCELLNVLHGDKERTEDLAVFRTETHNDVGVVLLNFQYKCASLQEQSVAAKLPEMPIKMAADDILEKEIDETAFEYPSHCHLEINWKSDLLKRGDRVCLIREGTKYKVTMPYFFLLWSAWDETGKPISFDVPDDDLAQSGKQFTYNWWVPDVLAKVYSASRDDITTTDPTMRSGNVHLPSSIDLSLPPGIYKLYLVRNETDAENNKCRTVLGTSASLAVLPGVNGVHTSFGTTPLVDVKSMSASLQVFLEANRDAVAASITNTDGFRAEDYFNRIALGQELAVACTDLQAMRLLVTQTTTKKKERALLEQKIPELEDVIQQLEQRKAAIDVGPSADVVAVDQVAVVDAGADRSRSQAVISNSGKVVFAYTFHGDAPSTRDRIVVVPADVVRVSDWLRATILGRLQANDQQQVEKARAAMELELVEVEEFFSARMSFKALRKVMWRYLKPLWQNLTTNSGATQKSDAYNAATGATDNTFVWEECMDQYNNCSRATRKFFPFIIRDLLDEIGARKKLLGLKDAPKSKANRRLGKATSLLTCGVELAIPLMATTFKKDSAGRDIAVGEVATVLGSRFRQGGFYVAKYVRRAAASPISKMDDDDTDVFNESAGELCRYGPFYVEGAMISFSPIQVAIRVGTWIYRMLKSEHGKLFLKLVGQLYLSFVKYFLAVVSLSFNINVLSGNFKIDVHRLQQVMDSVKARLAKSFGPLEIVLTIIYDFFTGFIQKLIKTLKMYDYASECVSGFFLVAVLGMLFAATFIVYVVVQEDLLRKVQKLHMYLPINPGKTVLGMLEQIGALLVIPMYLAIKSCVLFLSKNWSDFYQLIHDHPEATLANLSLYTTATPVCHDVSLAKVNHGVGIAALVLIIISLFVCLPLLLLDLFSWVPISELEEPDRLEKLAHSHRRMDIKAAVHSNANLVEFHPIRALRQKTAGCFSRLTTCCKCCARSDRSCGSLTSTCCTRTGSRNPLFAGFARHYDDYVMLPFRDLMKKYGVIGLLLMFFNVYAHLMLQSISRALGIFFGWRLKAEHMYPNPVMKSKSRWKVFDIFCLRFNLAWKVQYIKDKMIMPFVNICLVTLGLWGESQWKEFNVEERANDCYRMEPSGEIKQLQMMSLHGKIVSLFWLCIPETMVLAYLAEVLNRGPMFSYFLNRQFLQADIPESEREKDPVWRFHWMLAFKGEEDVVYLSDTRFYSTLLKWGSSIVEIISLLMVCATASQNSTVLFGITLISAIVTPVLEFNQQMIQAYMDYVETAENLVKSTGLVDKMIKAKKLVDKAMDALDDMPEVDINTRSLGARLGRKKASATDVATTKSGDQVAPILAGGGATMAGATGVKNPQVSQSIQSAKPGASKPITDTQSAVATQLAMDGSVLHLGSNSRHSNRSEHEANDSDDESTDDANEKDDDDSEDDDNQSDEGTTNDTALASLVASTGLLKTTKELIQLNAMPQVSYVVLTDALDAGEGEITISWQVNARQRFHALDAIGMFPARAKGDLSLRTMDDCICYRLLKHQGVEPFGWSPKNESEDAERELIMLQAKSLRDLSEREVSKMKKLIHEVNTELDTEEVVNARVREHHLKLKEADSTMEKIMQDPKLKPYKKKLPDILEDDIIANKVHEKAPRTSRAYSLGAAAREEAAKRTRKVVSGQAKFRPANNCVKEIDPTFETFIYGNDVGIYQSKYGLHGFEFCYLRCTEGDSKVVGVSSGGKDEDKKGGVGSTTKNQKVIPAGGIPAPEQAVVPKNYEILERFVSNSIQIGTFNIFMNLTCDRPLVGAKEKLNLSWIIYGVAYSILSNPKMRNCIGFYKVNGSEDAACARIEIIPPSAYLEAGDSEPCPGRMTVTTPNDAGVYEVRFLFNFFKKAQLHRQCQVFGELEDEMQQLRIRSFYEKRAVTEELRKFSLREPKVWGLARMNTQAWLKSMLLSTIREPVETSVIESTSAYSEFLFGRLKRKFQLGLENPSRMFQRRIAQILAPLRLNSFLDVLMVTFQSNSQLGDQLASVTFLSPTEEDEKKRGINRDRDMLLLPSDKELFLFGDVSFRLLARNYLSQRSLCGYHDFVDDILLNHGQLMQTLDQIINNLSSTCINLYESAIAAAIDEMATVAKTLKLTNALRGLDVMLMDLCRNHIQSMIRALLETDCRTGRKWPGRVKGSFEKLAALRAGTTSLQSDAEPSFEVVVDKRALDVRGEGPNLPGGAAPITREYVALRRWIWPKLERKIVAILKQRHARMMDGNWPIFVQLVASCRRPGLSLAGNPFPNHRKMKTESPVYFLEESRDKDAKRKRLEQTQNETNGDDAAKAGTQDSTDATQPNDPEDTNDDAANDDNQDDTNSNDGSGRLDDANDANDSDEANDEPSDFMCDSS